MARAEAQKQTVAAPGPDAFVLALFLIVSCTTIAFAEGGREGPDYQLRWVLLASDLLLGLIVLVQLPPFRSWPLALVVGLAVAAYLALVPMIFRWSRILWIHIGESMDW